MTKEAFDLLYKIFSDREIYFSCQVPDAGRATAYNSAKFLLQEAFNNNIEYLKQFDYYD